tara:strand:- start:2395 stop:3267 length:873 start_codon:yes stop_codon:yes gene_type:complete
MLQLQQLHPLPLGKFNLSVEDVLPDLLSVDPNKRMTAQEFRESTFFQDPKLHTLLFIEHIYDKDMTKKAAFFRQLHTTLDDFSDKVLIEKFLPVIMNVLLKEAKLRIFLIPSLAIIVDKMPTVQYEEQVWPHLRLLFTQLEHAKELIGVSAVDVAKMYDIDLIVLTLTHLPIFLKHGQNKASIRKGTLSLVVDGLDCSFPTVSDTAIKILHDVIDSVDYDTIRNNILPRVCSMSLGTPRADGTPTPEYLQINALTSLCRLVQEKVSYSPHTRGIVSFSVGREVSLTMGFL